MSTVSHVVWVAQWYPHTGEPYAGDFIQRQAGATAIYLPVHLFACFPAAFSKVEIKTIGYLTEHLIYFKPMVTGLKKLDKILYWQQWNRLLKKHLGNHFSTYGKPAVLHCHITLNAGWLGLWAKKKYQLPFVVSEHWSGYMSSAIDGFIAYNRWSKKLFHQIIRQAAFVITVSEALTQAMKAIENQGYYIRIPNVVDETVFYPKKSVGSIAEFQAIHISTFSPQKNMKVMLAGFDAFLQDKPSAIFHIVGPKDIFAANFPEQAASPNYVIHGEMPQTELANLMQQCDVCVLVSLYETFGCVIIEANAAGLPVVVSDTPVLREIVKEKNNGLLVNPDSPAALKEALLQIAARPDWFSKAQVSSYIQQQFSFEKIGKQLLKVYKKVAGETPQ